MIPRSYRIDGHRELELYFYSIYGNPFNYMQDEEGLGRLLELEQDIHILNQPRQKQQHTKLLLLVLSKCKQMMVRDKWREIITSFRIIYPIDILFVLSSNMDYNELVSEENEIHHDILQFSHVDNYYNITRSVISALQYISSYSDRIDFVLKTDSDCYLNFTKIMALVDTLSPAQSHFVGDCHCKGKYMLHRRGCPPISIVNSTARLPCYNYGGGYILSAKDIPRLMISFRHLDYLVSNEDINMGRAWHQLGGKCTFIANWLLLWQNLTDISEYYIYHGRGKFDRIWPYYWETINSLPISEKQ